MTTIRKIRNAAIAISIIFVCGILGSLELDTISLTEAIEYITISAAFCGFVAALEVIARFTRAMMIIYARRKKASRRGAMRCGHTSSRNARFA